MRVETYEWTHVDWVTDRETRGPGLNGQGSVIQLIITKPDAGIQKPSSNLLRGLNLVWHLLKHPHLSDDVSNLR